MNTQPSSDDSYNEDERDDESNEAVSEEKGLESAQSVFQGKGSNTEDSSLDEDKEFLKYLKFRQKAKELGLDNPSFTTIYHGGVHFTDSNVENHGNVVGNDQTIDSNINTGGFSGQTKSQLSDINENIESPLNTHHRFVLQQVGPLLTNNFLVYFVCCLQCFVRNEAEMLLYCI